MIRKDWEQKQFAVEAIERQKQNKNSKVKPGMDMPLREDHENERGTPIFTFAENMHAVGLEGKPEIIKRLPQLKGNAKI